MFQIENHIAIDAHKHDTKMAVLHKLERKY